MQRQIYKFRKIGYLLRLMVFWTNKYSRLLWPSGEMQVQTVNVGFIGPITIGISLEFGIKQLLSMASHFQSMLTTQNVVQALRLRQAYIFSTIMV